MIGKYPLVPLAKSYLILIRIKVQPWADVKTWLMLQISSLNTEFPCLHVVDGLGSAEEGSELMGHRLVWQDRYKVL